MKRGVYTCQMKRGQLQISERYGIMLHWNSHTVSPRRSLGARAQKLKEQTHCLFSGKTETEIKFNAVRDTTCKSGCWNSQKPIKPWRNFKRVNFTEKVRMGQSLLRPANRGLYREETSVRNSHLWKQHIKYQRIKSVCVLHHNQVRSAPEPQGRFTSMESYYIIYHIYKFEGKRAKPSP